MVDILRQNLTKDQADTYSLVLTACGISHRIEKSGRGWEIWADGAVYTRALQLIREYDLENPPRPPVDALPWARPERKTLSALWVSLCLLAIHVSVQYLDGSGQVLKIYSAAAAGILRGEVYRALTSLLLHVDYLHLAGNIVGISVLGTALCKITGPGSGWLIILLSGTFGNLANAAVIQAGHDSIGTSTAVFGALGFLAAYQFYRKKTAGGQHIKAWVPLAGGLALLGFLGAGPRTDLTAHLFGFLAGVCLGLWHTRYLSRFQGKKYQIPAAAAALGLVGTAGVWPLVF